MARTLPPLAAVAVVSTSATASSSPSCTIRGTDRSETLTGSAGRDVICAEGGNDRTVKATVTAASPADPVAANDSEKETTTVSD